MVVTHCSPKNIPIVFGMDYGTVFLNDDYTTNHFIVVVGMKSDNGSNHFQ